MAMRRYFTLDEATEALPWLRDQFAAIADSSERLSELEQQIDDLARHRQRNGHSNLGSVMHDKRQEARQLAGTVQTSLTSIERRGILVRDMKRGLVDFPSHGDDGREIHLCWLKDEATIGFWHPMDTGFGSRQPL